MKWLAGLLAAGALLVMPAQAGATGAATCEALEAGGYAYSAAECWEEVHAQEAAVARENEQIAREESEAAQEKATREEEKARRIKREERELAREEREAWQQAHRRIPTVRKNEAERLVRAVLHKQEPTWAFRRSGFVDCNGGRINRTHWRCRVRWETRSYMDWCGRAQVAGEEFENRRPFFRVAFKARPCYPY